MTDTLVIACLVDATLNRVPADKLGAAPRCGRCHNALFQQKPVELTAANFEAHAAKSDLPLVVDFWAEWCGPCRMMGPNFQAAAAELEPRVRLAKLDTEAEQAIAARFAIRSIPSLVMIRKGREVARTAGALPTPAIVQWVSQNLG
jgi:thioredoxin 2